MVITGVINGQHLQPLPGKAVLIVPVAVQGGQGARRWWFLNGEPVEQGEENSRVQLALRDDGPCQLVVMDEAGELAAVSFIRD